MGTKELAEETGKTVAGPRNGLKAMEEIEQNLKDLKEKHSTIETEDEGEVIEGIDFNFEDKDPEDEIKMLRVKPNSNRVKIRRCRFRNKKSLDPALVISNSEEVIVEDCIFENMRGGDKREAIRIGGDGRESGLSLKCTVRRCIFRNNSGDDEVISIKSANNTIEECFFINNGSDDDDEVSGNVTVRHGGLAKIRHNYFKGKNGVRIYGYGNRVEFNCFDNNTADANDNKAKKRCPITLWWGEEKYDPNWVPDKDEGEGASKPSEKFDNSKEGTHTVYARAVGTVIRGNEFKKCNSTIVEVKDGNEKDEEPIDTQRGHSEENVEKFSFEKNEE
jgi:hypothetical protein